MNVTERKLPVGYYRFACEKGGWYVATGTNSHGGPDGGTVGVLTSDGEFGVFFMHVCGGGEMPLVFPGSTPSEMMTLLRRSNPVYNRQQLGAPNP
jgi:hypothetical protein